MTMVPSHTLCVTAKSTLCPILMIGKSEERYSSHINMCWVFLFNTLIICLICSSAIGNLFSILRRREERKSLTLCLVTQADQSLLWLWAISYFPIFYLLDSTCELFPARWPLLHLQEWDHHPPTTHPWWNPTERQHLHTSHFPVTLFLF